MNFRRGDLVKWWHIDFNDEKTELFGFYLEENQFHKDYCWVKRFDRNKESFVNKNWLEKM